MQKILCAILIAPATLAILATSVVPASAMVVPPFGSAKNLKNVVTVATSGGDFTSPTAALASITTASASNPYLVLIGPGVFTLTQALVMKPYVTIAGSGEDATTLTGAISSKNTDATAAIVSGADHATLRDLNITNTGGAGENSLAMYNSGCSPVIENVTATASGGNYNYGVHNISASPVMTGVTATASGGELNYGVHNASSSSPAMTNVNATASGGKGNCGVYNADSSSPVMTDVTATASGGDLNYGMYNAYYCSPVMTGVIASASGGTESYGLYHYGSSAVIRHCTLKGTTKGLHMIGGTGGTTRVMQSSIIGGSANSGEPLTCVTSNNGAAAALNTSCQ